MRSLSSNNISFPAAPVFQVLLVFLLTLNCENPSGQSTTRISGAEQGEPVPFSLDELQVRTFNFFWNCTDSNHYQVLDRYPQLNFSSIAATGFGITAYLVGIERGFVTREQGADRVLRILRALWEMPQGPGQNGVSGHKGFFYHFLTLDEAVRYKNVELSTIDTGLLMAGVLSAQSYFNGGSPVETEIRAIADQLYRRVEWDWALNERGRLSMGWRPEKGFIENDWHGYNEAMILLILAIGSPTHPIPPESWEKWCETYQWGNYMGYEYLHFDPLFGHQYSQMYIDFREIRDPFMQEKGIDYFENSRRATYANRAWCMDNPNGCTGYSALSWGLTACDGPAMRGGNSQVGGRKYRGYSARGPNSIDGYDDCTIAPTAAGGSVPFAPEVCIPTLKNLWETHFEDLVGEYGFRDAINLDYTHGEGNENGWFASDYLGIDQGPILIQIENHRTGLVWEIMKKNPYIRAGLKRAGFQGGWLDKS